MNSMENNHHMESAIGSRIVLKDKSNFTQYKIDMALAVAEKFPDQSKYFNKVSLTHLPDKAGGSDDLKIPKAPKIKPTLPKDLTDKDAREIYKLQMEQWTINNDKFTKFQRESIALCSFIIRSTSGEARIKLSNHVDYQEAFLAINFRRIWQIILGLYVPNGGAKVMEEVTLSNKLTNISQASNESLISFMDRMNVIVAECKDLGIVFPDERLAVIFINGLKECYKSLKEYSITQPSPISYQSAKDLACRWPVGEEKKINEKLETEEVLFSKGPSMKKFHEMTTEEKHNKISRDRIRIGKVKCWNCKVVGHTARKCPKLEKTQ